MGSCRRASENRGFAGGNNAGAREARGRNLAFLNNDTIAESGWLAALRAGIDEPRQMALTTSRIVYMHNPAILDSAGDGVLRWGGAFKRHHGAPADVALESRESIRCMRRGVSDAEACLR
jgi:GT2 family glycosyltransferase